LEILGGAAEEEEAVATLSTESFTTELCKLWQARQENSPTLESGVAASLAGGAEWIAKAAEQQAEDLRLAAAAEGARQAEGVITGGMTEEEKRARDRVLAAYGGDYGDVIDEDGNVVEEDEGGEGDDGGACKGQKGGKGESGKGGAGKAGRGSKGGSVANADLQKAMKDKIRKERDAAKASHAQEVAKGKQHKVDLEKKKKEKQDRARKGERKS